MTNNNIKTVLFASVLAAILLPFSVMSFVDAASEARDEETPDQSGFRNENEDIPDIPRSELEARGYKLFPGVGWVSPDRPTVTPVYVENPHNPGEMIFDLDAMKEDIINNQELAAEMEEGTAYPSSRHDGYNAVAVKDEPNTMTYFKSFWEVPESPEEYSGGTIFHFNALQPFTGVIFQPVLQYGHSSICDVGNDGEQWVTYALIYIDPDSYIVTDCIPADEGDRLRGKVYKQSNGVWEIEMKNYNTRTVDSVSVEYNGKADTALAALETYYLQQECEELAGDIKYYSMSITGDSVDWVNAHNAERWCGMDVDIRSDRTVFITNDS